MAKVRTEFVCQACGARLARWEGRCPRCGEWNALEEVPTLAMGPRVPSFGLPHGRPQAISSFGSALPQRIPVPWTELGRVLGGGVVPGSVTLVSGDPGIGKSTLLLQMAAAISREAGKVLYVSGEESAHQIGLRAQRLGIGGEGLYILAETDLAHILEQARELSSRLMVIDSIQAMCWSGSEGMAGNVTQIRECTGQIMRLAKEEDIATFLVGHVTKSGAIAGPRLLEHMVDTVLYLEGDRFQSYRLLRSVKNRFGSTEEVGIFQMGERGMEEVPNPSQAFLAERLTGIAGSSVVVTMEGTRPLLAEIQALTTPSSLSQPRRTANGVDFNRLLLLVAVLSKRIGLELGTQDVFVNVVGGLRIEEPAADLPVALAIASSLYNRPVNGDAAIFGEIGLLGELRTVRQAEQRLREAARLGFGRCIIPRTSRVREEDLGGLEVLPVATLREALEIALQG